MKMPKRDLNTTLVRSILV